jgi:hypothetical protein
LEEPKAVGVIREAVEKVGVDRGDSLRKGMEKEKEG